MSEPLDEERVRVIAKQLFKIVVDHYKSSPTPERSHVLEVLNALAVTTGTVLAGCDARAHVFFILGLENQITELRANPPRGDDHG
jgi:hypothetical protein